MSVRLYRKGEGILGLTKTSQIPRALLRAGKIGLGAGLGGGALLGALALGSGTGRVAQRVDDHVRDMNTYYPESLGVMGPAKEEPIFTLSDLERNRELGILEGRSRQRHDDLDKHFYTYSPQTVGVEGPAAEFPSYTLSDMNKARGGL